MTITASAPSKHVPLKSIALPSEHGGWGFLLEPLLLGILLAPSWAGFLLALSTVSVFLLRHPLRIVITDWKRGRRFKRTRVAERFVIGYGLLAGSSFALAVMLAGPFILLPLLIAIPFALVMIGFDVRGVNRHWLPELAGPVALASSAAMITLAGGWSLWPALGLIVLLAARAIPAILYVRARIRLAKGWPTDTRLPWLAHAGSFVGATALALTGRWPALTAVAFGILLIRSLAGLHPARQTTPAKIIGFQEIGYGLFLVAMTAAGFYLGL